MHNDGNKRLNGAIIERGKIAAAGDDGYTVVSLDREGIVSPPIKAIGDTEYEPGDIVYFFLFADGTGAILAPVL
jgi:hypothetical protein